MWEKCVNWWEERGRAGDLLWTGASYREFELWRERYPGGLTESEEAFAHAMSVLAEKQKRRRRVLLTGAFSALVVVLAIVGGLWRQEIAEARRAESAKAFLVKMGVPAARLACVSFGEEKLVTQKEAEFELNRRVEFRVVK